MKNLGKNLVLLLAIPFIAASCTDLFLGNSGAMGVFRTDDFGSTFREANSVDKNSNLSSTSPNVLIMDPSNTGTLYIGSSAGIHRSTNGGENWTHILAGMLVADVAIDPKDSNTIYAAGISDNHATIIKTGDAGATWKSVYTEPTTSTAVRTLVVDPKDSKHLLAGLQTGEIISSGDFGTTWQPESRVEDRIIGIRYGPNLRPYLLTETGGLHKSTDEKNFTGISSQLTDAIISFDSNLSAVSQFLDMQFDARQPGVIYMATNEGLVRTVDDGINWTYVRMPLRNELLRTSAVAINPKDSNNIFATVGRTLFRSINGGLTWETLTLPTDQETRMILIDPNSPNTIYFGFGVRK